MDKLVQGKTNKQTNQTGSQTEIFSNKTITFRPTE